MNTEFLEAEYVPSLRLKKKERKNGIIKLLAVQAYKSKLSYKH